MSNEITVFACIPRLIRDAAVDFRCIYQERCNMAGQTCVLTKTRQLTLWRRDGWTPAHAMILYNRQPDRGQHVRLNNDRSAGWRSARALQNRRSVWITGRDFIGWRPTSAGCPALKFEREAGAINLTPVCEAAGWKGCKSPAIRTTWLTTANVCQGSIICCWISDLLLWTASRARPRQANQGQYCL